MLGREESKKWGVCFDGDRDARKMNDDNDEYLKWPQVPDYGENVFVMKSHGELTFPDV